MSDIAIRVENLGKRYTIGRREGYLTLRDVLMRAIKDVSFEVKEGEVVGILSTGLRISIGRIC